MDAQTRCRYVASLYCKLGTLTAVGNAMGLTRERVRQIMNEGHRNGWCTYRPSSKQSACNAIPLLPDAIKKARSKEHLFRLCGLEFTTGSKLLKSLGLLNNGLTRTLRKNKQEFYMGRLLEEAERLGVKDTLHTGVLQSDPVGSNAYNLALRHIGGIQEIRKLAGVACTARRIS